MAKPDSALIKRVLDNLITGEDVDYFFDNLTSPDWIEPLASKGFFTSPPAPVPVDGGFQLPPWSALRYLVRVAARSPEQVRNVLKAMPETDNARVHHDYAEAVLALPPKMAVEFVPRLIGWLSSPFRLLLPQKLVQLLRRLATAGFADAAISLASALFDVRAGDPVRTTTDDGRTLEWPVEVRPVIDDYQYERLLSESLPDFIGGTGFRGLTVLSDLLARAMTLEARDPEERRHDYSFVWRPAIEPHPQNNIPSTRSAIITAVRDAAVELARTDQSSLAQVVAQLEGYSWAVHRRIALDVIRVAAPKRSILVSERLTGASYFYDGDLLHEFWMLLHDRFAGLTGRQQRLVLDAIKAGPPIYTDPEEPCVGDREIGLKAWQARLLAAISDDLPPDERAWFDRLVAENRLSDHPELLSYMDGGFVGPTSPLSNEKFAAMSHDELLEFLHTWHPDSGWDAPSPEGLGHLLETAVKDDPGRYAEIALSFQAVPPIYINSVLQGFRNAAASGQVFSWERVLRLAKQTLDRGAALRPASAENAPDLPWSWTRSTTAHLLDVGFNDGPAQIPFQLRELAWSVLRPLSDDPDPTEESEERFGGDNMDPTTLAVNTVRGQAIGSVVKYAVWVHRHLEAGRPPRNAIGFDRMPEVREVLDDHLDLDHDPSYAIHSLYGQWFPWLGLVDEAWAAENVGRIFPADEGHFLYWEAALEAYLSFCRPYDSSLNLLKEEYRRAVGRLARQSPDRKHPMLAWQNLADHLMVYYLRGRLDLDDGLLQEFFNTAPVELRAVALRFIGRSSYTIEDRMPRPLDPPASGELVDRAIALWEARIAVAEAAEDRSAVAPEMAEFGWWFVSPAFDPEWALTQIARALRQAGSVEYGHLVGRRLAELVSAYPEQVLEVLDLMMKGQSDDWLVLGEESVTEVLRSGLSGPEDVRENAEQITHGLGARGYRQFRGLLQPGER
jgi:hypothetical protein